MNRNGLTEQSAVEAREKYVMAWNETMIRIWQEQITLLDVIDTAYLLGSTVALPVAADGRFYEIRLRQQFVEYGLWQNYGTGKETPRKGRSDESKYRDSSGRLLNDKVREARPWFSKRYYSSVMALKDFLADSIGEEFVGIISDAFNERNLRHRY